MCRKCLNPMRLLITAKTYLSNTHCWVLGGIESGLLKIVQGIFNHESVKGLSDIKGKYIYSKID